MKSQFSHYFILAHYLCFVSSYTYCTFDETLQAVFPCNDLVNKRIALSHRPLQNESGRIGSIRKVCDEFKKCISTIECHDNLSTRFMKESCENIEMEEAKVVPCMAKIFEQAYNRSDVDFLKENITSASLMTHKNVLLSMANSTCNQSSSLYISEHYDDLVNILTIGNKNCEGVHHTIIEYQCSPSQAELEQALGGDNQTEILEWCEKAMNCYKNKCLPWTFRTYKNYKNRCKAVNTGNDFFKCARAVLKSPEWRDSQCVAEPLPEPKNRCKELPKIRECYNGIWKKNCKGDAEDYEDYNSMVLKYYDECQRSIE